MMTGCKYIDGRPRLPCFNPAGTPSPHDAAAWRAIAAQNRTNQYAAETLLHAHDAAFAEGNTRLKTTLHTAIWVAAHHHIEKCVGGFDLRVDPDLAATPIDAAAVEHRAADYVRKAIECKVSPRTNRPHSDYAGIRSGFYSLLTKRCIDAVRVERSVHTKAGRMAKKARDRMQALRGQLKGAVNGRDVEVLAMMEDKKNAAVIEHRLEGNMTWEQISRAAGLPSADAARKRFERCIRRLVAKGRQ